MATSAVMLVPLLIPCTYTQNQRSCHKPNGKRKLRLSVDVELTLHDRRVDRSRAATVKEFSQKPKDNSQWEYTNFPSIRADFKRICLEGRVKEAMDIFSDRNRQGIPADHDTYADLLQACATAKALTEVSKMHAKCLTKYLNEICSYGML